VTGSEPLAFENFAEYLADGLELDVASLDKNARLVEDLVLDSFDLIELVVLVEELGTHLPDHVVVGIDTIGDLYDAYALRATRMRRPD
jgi:acyl carrier protein